MSLEVVCGDAWEVLHEIPDGSIDCVVTSPPYLDQRPEYGSDVDYAAILVELARVVSGPLLFNVGRVFRQRRELLWWLEVVRAAEQAGLVLLDTLVWTKKNSNPIHGRVFHNAHEYVLVLGRPDCVLNVDAIRQPYAAVSVGRMARRWVNGRGTKGDKRGNQRGRRMHPLGARPRSYVAFSVGKEKGNPHPSPMPLDLADYLVRLASWPSQTVLDPFAGSGTTGRAALAAGRSALLIDNEPRWCEEAERRLADLQLSIEPAA